MSNPRLSDEELSERFDAVRGGQLSDLTEEQSRLIDGWVDLRSCLQRLPSPTVDIASRVRDQLESTRLVVAASSPKTGAPPRQSAFAVIASSLTIVVCLFSLMYFPAPLPDLTFRQSLFSGFTSSELASGFSNCDVVMVTMPDGPEKTNDFLRTSLTSHGLESHSIAIDSRPSSGSQLLGSNADSDEVLGALTFLHDATGGEPVDDMQREEILAKLFEAIETPSLAEEHFDDYVVVLPREVINDMREKNTAIADTDLPAKTQPSTSAAIPPESRKVVFVVRRKKAAAADQGDADEPRGGVWNQIRSGANPELGRQTDLDAV